jgi:putative transposase
MASKRKPFTFYDTFNDTFDSSAIEPGKPQQNGQHERMHRVLKAETARPPAANLTQQQRWFDRFRHEYNQLRPHVGIDLQTQSSLYMPSSRPMPTAPL